MHACMNNGTHFSTGLLQVVGTVKRAIGSEHICKYRTVLVCTIPITFSVSDSIYLGICCSTDSNNSHNSIHGYQRMNVLCGQAPKNFLKVASITHLDFYGTRACIKIIPKNISLNIDISEYYQFPTRNNLCPVNFWTIILSAKEELNYLIHNYTNPFVYKEVQLA